MEHGTLGGRFTTVEGLLTNISDQLSNKNPFFAGDSAMAGTKDKLREFCDKLDKVRIVFFPLYIVFLNKDSFSINVNLKLCCVGIIFQFIFANVVIVTDLGNKCLAQE